MINKLSEVKQDVLLRTKNDIKTMLSNMFGQIDNTLKQTNITDDQKVEYVRGLVDVLDKEIDTKINEMVGQQVVTIPAGTTANTNFISKRHAYWQGGGGINEPDPKKTKYKPEKMDPVVPRGDGEKLQMFWKRNLDYGEGPWSNLDKMDGKDITDCKHTLIEDGRFKKPKNKT